MSFSMALKQVRELFNIFYFSVSDGKLICLSGVDSHRLFLLWINEETCLFCYFFKTGGLAETLWHTSEDHFYHTTTL
jgi:hypothetical protein